MGENGHLRTLNAGKVAVKGRRAMLVYVCSAYACTWAACTHAREKIWKS